MVDGQSYRVSRRCPHREGRLDHGTVHVGRRTIACPLHRSVFSLETGEQLSGPACGHITVIKVAADPVLCSL
ncbi:MAG: Rieske 2Fe-2S domain-containing protein [Lysobacter sp.]|nr:Rieske 2Fe-2S domain-containing protein [Lysobacter sp.]